MVNARLFCTCELTYLVGVWVVTSESHCAFWVFADKFREAKVWVTSSTYSQLRSNKVMLCPLSSVFKQRDAQRQRQKRAVSRKPLWV